MQSGISASAELHSAFKEFLADTTQYALLALIENETIVPSTVVATKSDLPAHLHPDRALYILLRHDPASGIAAVTYVPNAAPVRAKTLAASTRLTLVRELGSEHFAESLFVTEAAELTDEGWRRHLAHTEAERPLTQEERDLEGIREAEALESGGTGRRGGGYGTSRVGSKIGQGVVEALRSLGNGSGGNLVQIKMDVQEEQLELVGPSESVDLDALSGSISDSEPRYTFYRYEQSGAEGDAPVIFIYTCPPTAKPKDRMLYAASKRGAVSIAENEAGVKVAKKLEASEPSEITVSMIQEEFAPKVEAAKTGFSRPKRPGRR